MIDASVLLQEPVRSLLLWIAAEGLYQPLWSERILAETGRNLVSHRALDASKWAELEAQLLLAFPDALVDQAMIDEIEGSMPNDPKDRHVLAAAVVSGAPVVVTNNLKHFRHSVLLTVGKTSRSADEFLVSLLEKAPDAVRSALDEQVSHMTNPRQWTVGELLGRLAGIERPEPLARDFAQRASATLGFPIEAPPPRSM